MHTKGPWRRGQEGNLRVYGPDGQGEDSGLIATVHRASCINLIAAAPELLAALEQLWAETIAAGNDTAADYGWPSARKAVLAALAKVAAP